MSAAETRAGTGSGPEQEADGTVEVSAAAEGAQLLLAARQWLEQDPDAGDRDELRELLRIAQDPSTPEKTALAAVEDLADRFSGTLQFGTAGLRAVMGAGPLRMNRAVVRRAAAGVAAYALHLVQQAEPDGAAPRAVIGFDARHRSADFARDTAAVLVAAGLEVELMPRALPTPVLAWAVREHRAEVGVMVTASHNPAVDNGYKVYLGGRAVQPQAQGCQIVAPHDAEIARRIEDVGDLRELPVAETGWQQLPEDIDRRYLEAIGAALRPAGRAARPVAGRETTGSPVRIVLTAMHGVGGPTTLEALRRAGFDDVRPVPEQFDPDPEFPTVSFPNPEEAGALDLATALAREIGADLILANDPDADRCAVAVPVTGDPRAAQGWRALTGDEVGALLGLAALRAVPAPGGAAVVANSIVSSRLLGRMAAAHGMEHRETLTGFKWIARVPDLVFGYEEALGYCVAPQVVRDKDGISAAVAIAQLARESAARGDTLLDELDAIALEHGLHTTGQLSIRVEDLARIPQMMTSLRESAPAELAGSPVVSVEDLSAPDPASATPPTEGMRLLSEDGTRVIVRPSGTEPKLKCYLETITAVTEAQELPAAREAAQARLTRLAAQLETLLGA